MTTPTAAGLCDSCAFQRLIRTRTGSTFVLCGRAATDPAFPRYPVLPVHRCAGYEKEQSDDAV